MGRLVSLAPPSNQAALDGSSQPCWLSPRACSRIPCRTSDPTSELYAQTTTDVPDIPCVVYAAKSTEDRRGSIPDQTADCLAAIAQAGERVVIAEYADESFSAFRRSRGPELVDAMEHAEDLVREFGTAELWAQHSDRLARGDGRIARHVVEIGLWALKRDVVVRTVQDPDTFRDLLGAVVTGQRNHEDSRRKGAAMRAGRRRAAARGEFIGYRPDGYVLEVELQDGEVKKRMVLDPDRQEIIETIFRMALRGRPTGAIARHLNDQGWLTNPRRKDATPQHWRVHHVDAVLRNWRYAGLAVFGGEVLGRGHWPAYINEAQQGRGRPAVALRMWRCDLTCGHQTRSISRARAGTSRLVTSIPWCSASSARTSATSYSTSSARSATLGARHFSPCSLVHAAVGPAADIMRCGRLVDCPSCQGSATALFGIELLRQRASSASARRAGRKRGTLTQTQPRDVRAPPGAARHLPRLTPSAKRHEFSEPPFHRPSQMRYTCPSVQEPLSSPAN